MTSYVDSKVSALQLKTGEGESVETLGTSPVSRRLPGRFINPAYNFLRLDFWFGQLDGRPFSLFRIVMALLMLKEVVYHIPIAGLFYSDSGVFPRSLLLTDVIRAQHLSLMEAIPTDWLAVLFFLAWGIVALGLLFGYRTRLMSVLNYVIILSVHERNVFVLTGADTVLRMLCFWMIFIDLSQYYSLDAVWRRRTGDPRATGTVYAFPVRMLQIQIAIIYIVTALTKMQGDQWLNGTAMNYVVQLQSMLLPTGHWLAAMAPDWVLRSLTYMTLVAEIGFAFFMFAPFFQPVLKIVGLMLVIGLHAGIALTMIMPLPDFSLIMLTSYVVFFDPDWALWIDPKLSPPLLRLSRVNFIRDRLNRATNWLLAHYAPPQIPRYAALHKGFNWKGLFTLALAGIMLCIVWWNIQNFVDDGYIRAPAMPAALQDLVRYSGTWQYWDMFAPIPLQNDGWIVLPGKFEDGTALDVRTGQPVRDGLPDAPWGPLMRWKKYDENANNNRDDQMLQAWAGYYCRQYNVVEDRPPGKRLATLEIHYIYTHSHAPGAPTNAQQDDLLWSHNCLS